MDRKRFAACGARGVSSFNGTSDGEKEAAMAQVRHIPRLPHVEPQGNWTLHTPEAACEAFVAGVKDLPQVLQVLVTGSGSGTVIWTIISAPEADDFQACLPIYEAEGDVLGALSAPLVDFKVINLDHYAGDTAKYVIPTSGRILWSREGVA